MDFYVSGVTSVTSFLVEVTYIDYGQYDHLFIMCFEWLILCDQIGYYSQIVMKSINYITFIRKGITFISYSARDMSC